MIRLNSWLIILLILVVALSACAFHPVIPQAQFDATVTARAQLAAMNETATPEPPPAPTIEPEVVPLTPVATAAPCLIKVNRAGDGTLVYHLPGQPTYNQTKVDPNKDEFYACTEVDAIAAGARKALR